MTESKSQNDRVLASLSFELKEGRGPKLLVAVCDESDRADQLRRQLDEEIRLAGKTPASLVIPPATNSIVDAIFRGNRAGTNGIVHLVEAKRLTSKQVDKLFAELNFQRDSLSHLEIP